MDQSTKDLLTKIAHTVRALSADAIEKQHSGHPGLPLGAAEIGAYLFTKVLKYNPENPGWKGRDRFILSAGHGSMLLYALLHLSGYDLSIEEIKNFRLLHSKTPGHPELGETPGVEVTTGPLGQGIAAGTGMAIAQKIVAARFGEELFDSKIWILAGDGCMMEGISAEAGSLAGTLGLNNLVIIYDSNDVSLDGPLSDAMIEDTARRYEAYGFKVMTIDGYDFDQMETAFGAARDEEEKPVLVIAKTIIGKYAPVRQGQCSIHGAYLGPEEMRLFKQKIGWPEEPMFYIPREVRDYFSGRKSDFREYENTWNEKFKATVASNPSLYSLWCMFESRALPDDFSGRIWDLDLVPNQPTRRYNETIVARVGSLLPFFITGSADVASCDFTWLPESGIVTRHDWMRQQIKFGVREFCMAACAYGMQIHGMLQPVVGTFLVFSDYMRNAIRMAALMKQRVIFVYSHDSLLLAQDGPTHQPIEHLMSLRLIPNLTLIRPCDENESKAAWISAFQIKDQPVVLCFTRQPVASGVRDLTARKAREGLMKGAYQLYGPDNGNVDVQIYATGSEINPAAEAGRKLETDGYAVQLISVPSWELFDVQPEDYKRSITGIQAKLRVSVEAGRGLGWQKFIGCDGLMISQDTYGVSAPESVMADHFGFTAEKIYQKIKDHIASVE